MRHSKENRMRKLTLICLTILFSLPSLAGSLECHISKGLKSYPIVETTEGIDEEEESETYAGIIDSVEADILYLPYQEGIYLTLIDTKRGVTASSINSESAEVSYDSPEGHYRLSCREI